MSERPVICDPRRPLALVMTIMTLQPSACRLLLRPVLAHVLVNVPGVWER